MKHVPTCRWQTTTPEECEFRNTHHYCPHPEHTCDCDGEPKFAVGDNFMKTGGDYKFKGEIVAVFKKVSGKTRYVGENSDGLLFIFNESSIEPYDPDQF